MLPASIPDHLGVPIRENLFKRPYVSRTLSSPLLTSSSSSRIATSLRSASPTSQWRQRKCTTATVKPIPGRLDSTYEEAHATVSQEPALSVPSTSVSTSSQTPFSLERAFKLAEIIWGFTESDFVTFVIPDMVFGLLGAFARIPLVDNVPPPSFTQILFRAPAVLLYNWLNLIIFDLANQSSPESVAEDKINKPWRPIPQGKISMKQTRRLMLVAIPLSMAINYSLGVTIPGMLIHLVTWLYNDLQGGDEPILRELLIAVGYGMFNSGSLIISSCGAGISGGEHCALNYRGYGWTALISTVIFTTMQIQDLKDQEGDRLRNRKTIVLFFGSVFSRWSIAFFVLLWSFLCSQYWIGRPISVTFLPVLAQAIWVAWRVVSVQTQKGDRKTWKLWCWWLVLLYITPVTSKLDLSA